MIYSFTIETRQREEMVNVTSILHEAITKEKLETGLVFCFVPHTTAAITINENADPDVTRDILYKLHKEIPRDEDYLHAEGNSDAHVKTSLIGASEQVMFENRKLVLGRWQAVYFCEFDGPRQRQLIVRVIPFA